MIDERLVTVLSGVAGGRIYPLVAPQPATTPYVVYTRVSSTLENVLAGNGTPPIDNTRFQVDCYSKTYSEALTVASAVQAAMLGWSERNVQISSSALYEDDVKLFRFMMDFSVWHTTP